MKHKITAGDFKGWDIVESFNLLEKPRLYFTNVLNREELSKNTVERYEIINKNTGLLKNFYLISIVLKNGKKALIEADEKFWRKLLQLLY